MKKQTKWTLGKIEVFRDGVVDKEFSGYDLQKNGTVICKFGLDSLRELKDFFEKLDLSLLTNN